MPTTPDQLHPLAGRLLDAFDREFWAGHHDHARLIAAPLEVLHDAVAAGADATELLPSVLQSLRQAAAPR